MAITTVQKLTTFPAGTDADDLAFDELIEQMIGDDVYVAEGTLDATDLAAMTGDQATIASNLASYFDVLGELAEAAAKVESKNTALKTRNYKVAGKRTTTVEISLVGISNLQKAFLESTAFTGTTVTMFMQNTEKDRVIIFNGMKWAVDWDGTTDGLWNVKLSTEFTGATSDRVYVYKDIPATAGT
ncbi:MAG: hypothetical protein LHW45_08160 [Candidatus Cloacimonetes bacterium]|nr:hypothetical protein [Candidatus Cloacimonadota bacterium]MDY0367582.1 hypothetical protein [Candidatus Syntrophosphaera sp.]